ncbi:2-polyprenyl-6-methoxyphenol hydroxylase-like FAD-dependent oxidoreductase [Nonomuraea muscovyensis]|uniref:2-polyprenyl-6-methoxyphenol hydroxylase-like FAD-dependent oxidoreductase n=1 Tax=Nonomuraea muscovyensis TaxID=1124761 RepID=A0A7X0BZK2_9ACTN|nr:FAD-dependent monooxygenase [Nonomuraea muscovyensis]MBB6345598.1 2-polyprenyl-6-methoxyphenol hydroxylase-like FAD-dependent oxidoreductase [Nonomuraea muscovyensis]
MTNISVLISGASIAGPALAHWLARSGATVTVVEKAPVLRTGGQAVDFKGETHLELLRRMGILEEVERRQTGGTDQTVIDSYGKRITVMPGWFTGGDLEILRGDLAEILYGRTRDTCRYIFGDSITSLTETASGVHVTFERGAPQTFDVVVGADGIHSNVRRLAFGPEADYVKNMGHYYALVDMERVVDEPVMYNEPGRLVSIGGPKAPAFFCFASPELTYDRYSVAEQKQILIDAYRGMGWRTPEILAKLARARDVYVDAIAQVTLERFSKGRIVLLGDAAAANTLGGVGTGLALVAAYVLAGELSQAGYGTAFERYEETIRPFIKAADSNNAGPFLAPRTRKGIWLRNQLFKRRFLLSSMAKMGEKMAGGRFELPDYTSLSRPASTTEPAPVVAPERGDASSATTSATS